MVADRTCASLVKWYFELPHAVQVEEDSDVYGSLDPSLTLLMHGVETDWIEEEMADDDDFRSSLHIPKKQTMKIDYCRSYTKKYSKQPYNKQRPKFCCHMAPVNVGKTST